MDIRQTEIVTPQRNHPSCDFIWIMDIVHSCRAPCGRYLKFWSYMPIVLIHRLLIDKFILIYDKYPKYIFL